MSKSLLKTDFRSSLSETTLNEIQCGTANYYYFWGKTTDWAGSVETPSDGYRYESQVRDGIVNFKKIASSDVSYVIPKHNWVSGTTYDMYDDSIGTTIEYPATGIPATYVLNGTFDLSEFGVGWLVSGTNVADGSLVVEANQACITLSKPLIGVVSNISIIKTGLYGAVSLNDPTCKFYCVTSDDRVYKCINNNGGQPSTIEPGYTVHYPFETPDGYIWKYMYTIPSYLKNKFATATEIPVVTADRTKIYSDGSINSVEIVNPGTGYASNTSISVSGDGQSSFGAYKIIGISLENVGSGYSTTPTVSIEPPFNVTTEDTFIASHQYLAGSYIVNSLGYIYQVYVSGLSGTVEPTYNGQDYFTNGTLSLKYVGTWARATATYNNFTDTVTDVSLVGYLFGVKILNSGSGYNPNRSPIDVTITGADYGTATAIIAADGTISEINITNPGAADPTATATIEDPIATSVTFDEVDVNVGDNTVNIPNHSFVTGDKVSIDSLYQLYIIAVDSDNIKIAYSYQLAISNTAMSIEDLELNIGSHTISTLCVGAVLKPTIIYGDGYNFEPSVTIQSPDFGTTAQASIITEIQTAKLEPIIDSGSIIGVTIVDGGVGYTTADIKVSGVGTGAVIKPIFSPKTIDSIQASIEDLAVAGSIDAISVLHPGENYETAELEIVGDGQGCQATAVLDEYTGAINSIVVVSAGSGYTRASVVITGTAKTNTIIVPAYLRPIMSPKNGHGSNAVKELAANDLLLATRIDYKHLQSGFSVTEDFHQYGIIKNPVNFDNTGRFLSSNGSACHVITGEFDVSLATVGSILVDENDNQYRVIAHPNTISSTSISLLVQALGDASLAIDQKLYYATALDQSVTITYVSTPEVDKYSGEMLYICNSEPFKSMLNQTVALNTYFRF